MDKDPFVHPKKGNTPIESYSRDGKPQMLNPIRIGMALDTIFLYKFHKHITQRTFVAYILPETNSSPRKKGLTAPKRKFHLPTIDFQVQTCC